VDSRRDPQRSGTSALGVVVLRPGTTGSCSVPCARTLQSLRTPPSHASPAQTRRARSPGTLAGLVESRSGGTRRRASRVRCLFGAPQPRETTGRHPRPTAHATVRATRGPWRSARCAIRAVRARSENTSKRQPAGTARTLPSRELGLRCPCDPTKTVSCSQAGPSRCRSKAPRTASIPIRTPAHCRRS